MKQIILEKIIKEVQNEKCPIHNKVAHFEVDSNVVLIKEFCCSDFYKDITARIKKEMDSTSLSF